MRKPPRRANFKHQRNANVRFFWPHCNYQRIYANVSFRKRIYATVSFRKQVRSP
jgi:hypothetical protein